MHADLEIHLNFWIDLLGAMVHFRKCQNHFKTKENISIHVHNDQILWNS